MISLVLLVVALVMFVLAAIGVPSGKFNLIGVGLACVVAAQLAGKL